VRKGKNHKKKKNYKGKKKQQLYDPKTLGGTKGREGIQRKKKKIETHKGDIIGTTKKKNPPNAEKGTNSVVRGQESSKKAKLNWSWAEKKKGVKKR